MNAVATLPYRTEWRHHLNAVATAPVLDRVAASLECGRYRSRTGPGGGVTNAVYLRHRFDGSPVDPGGYPLFFGFLAES